MHQINGVIKNLKSGTHLHYPEVFNEFIIKPWLLVPCLPLYMVKQHTLS